MLWRLAWVTALLSSTVSLPAWSQVATGDQVCAPAADPCVVETALSVTDGAVLDFGTRTLMVTSTGKLDAGDGRMTVRAGSLIVEPFGRIVARGSTDAGGGTVTIATSGDMHIDGAIDVSGSAAGSISLTASGAVTLSGRFALTADGLGADGSGGVVEVNAASLDVGGPISATGGSDGIGGDVTLLVLSRITFANDVDVSGGEFGSGELTAHCGGDIELQAGSALRANAGGSGAAQGIELIAGDANLGGSEGALIVAGAIVSSGGSSPDGGGDGGEIDLNASGDCRIAGRVTAGSGQPAASGGTISVSCGSDRSAMLMIAGEIDASGNGSESTGGEVHLDSTGSVAVAGDLLARGASDGGGGMITIDSETAINVTSTAAIRVGATGSGSAGAITMTAGTALSAAGIIAADGGDDLEGGGSGGSVDLSAGSACDIGADISATSGAVDASGGDVSVDCGSADGGATVIEGQIDASGNGHGSDGGSISVDASGALTVSGTLFAKGGLDATAGEITLASDQQLDLPGTIRADAVGNASAGTITLNAATLRVSGTISAIGGSAANSAGSGGTVSISIDAACDLGGQVFATSGQPDGSGGSISVSCAVRGSGTTAVAGTVDARGQGTGSGGGSVSVTGGREVTVSGRLDVRGGVRGGGDIGITGESVVVSGVLFVAATGGPAGMISAAAPDDSIRIDDSAVFLADADDGNPGGSVRMHACIIDVVNGSRGSALGSSGMIDLTGVNRIAVAGALSADTGTGVIRLSSRDSAPLVESAARIMPTPRLELLAADTAGCERLRPTASPTASPTATPSPRPSLTPTVPTRATTTPTPSATRTSTASPSPSVIAERPGDANCDGRIDAADASAAAAMLFDRREPSCALADANSDGTITAADLTAVVAAIAAAVP